MALVVGFSSSQLIQTIDFSIKKEIPKDMQVIINDCELLGLSDTAKCLVSNVKSFFIYQKTNDAIDLNFSELKLNGGDCKDYSELYKELGDNLGFDTEYVDITIEGNKAHRFVILSNEEGYCVLDQVNKPICFVYKNE